MTHDPAFWTEYRRRLAVRDTRRHEVRTLIGWSYPKSGLPTYRPVRHKWRVTPLGSTTRKHPVRQPTRKG